MKALRSLHLHNEGKATQEFIDRIQDPAIRVGDECPTTIDYTANINIKIHLTALEIDLVARAKYSNLLAH